MTVCLGGLKVSRAISPLQKAPSRKSAFRRLHWPVPESLAVCGLLVALSVMVNVVVLDPLPEGVKVTEIEHVFPAGKLEQLFV